jgi:hypothetical protein
MVEICVLYVPNKLKAADDLRLVAGERLIGVTRGDYLGEVEECFILCEMEFRNCRVASL